MPRWSPENPPPPRLLLLVVVVVVVVVVDDVVVVINSTSEDDDAFNMVFTYQTTLYTYSSWHLHLLAVVDIIVLSLVFNSSSRSTAAAAGTFTGYECKFKLVGIACMCIFSLNSYQVRSRQ